MRDLRCSRPPRLAAPLFPVPGWPRQGAVSVGRGGLGVQVWDGSDPPAAGPSPPGPPNQLELGAPFSPLFPQTRRGRAGSGAGRLRWPWGVTGVSRSGCTEHWGSLPAAPAGPCLLPLPCPGGCAGGPRLPGPGRYPVGPPGVSPGCPLPTSSPLFPTPGPPRPPRRAPLTKGADPDQAPPPVTERACPSSAPPPARREATCARGRPLPTCPWRRAPRKSRPLPRSGRVEPRGP